MLHIPRSDGRQRSWSRDDLGRPCDKQPLPDTGRGHRPDVRNDAAERRPSNHRGGLHQRNDRRRAPHCYDVGVGVRGCVSRPNGRCFTGPRTFKQNHTVSGWGRDELVRWGEFRRRVGSLWERAAHSQGGLGVDDHVYFRAGAGGPCVSYSGLSVQGGPLTATGGASFEGNVRFSGKVTGTLEIAGGSLRLTTDSGDTLCQCQATQATSNVPFGVGTAVSDEKAFAVGNALVVNTRDGVIDLMGSTLINGADPATPGALCTKRYVDALLRGFVVKPAVRAASTVNLDLTSPVGNLADAAVLLASGDRVLLWHQTNAVENGIYVVTPQGYAARAGDLAIGTFAAQALVYVMEGTYVGRSLICISPSTACVVNTHPLGSAHHPKMFFEWFLLEDFAVCLPSIESSSLTCFRSRNISTSVFYACKQHRCTLACTVRFSIRGHHMLISRHHSV
ncbi:uncharacterized protein EV422DRAFT_130163 [Fimicolochytrium jonesii]|uniref:uncharacterized protein n=1 Tax=Fimicolochytrium jonesii TaxID=1396493 RepID=UPI0022FE6CD8|nr:uncharacterized protein EV422DRAFT_130163 [Fimicolochytrium jonesii]KAI8819021.1 hypothetical protein EV422DRAFT_130163 [Fimicolochytrium jonesii]